MPAHLVALNDGPNILVDKPILLVGRHPECDVQIESRKISRRHCCIAQVNDYLVIRDLDSTNGVRINGIRVVEGKLVGGDEVTIGNSRFRVTWQEAAPRGRDKRDCAPAPIASSTQDEDDLLEACDEPVALPDPSRMASVPRPVSRPKQKTEESLVIPENIELLPGSGSYPGGPAPRRP